MFHLLLQFKQYIYYRRFVLLEWISQTNGSRVEGVF
jgi:hypothetical protein